jgi:hypothetical protein
MSARLRQIGFTMRLRLEWMDRTVGLLSAGSPRANIKATLDELLKNQISVNSSEGRGSRDKTITILLKTWVTVPRHVEPLRNEGLDHFRRLSSRDLVPLHWGMAMAVYPFFSVVAETIGRLLRLQETAGAAHIQRRVRELLGERETVSRATRRILRTMVDWGALSHAEDKGVYQLSPSHRINDTRLAAWLVEATLVASGSSSAPTDVILRSPALFPFQLPHISTRDLDSTDRLEVYREGGDMEMLALRRNGNRR